MLLAKWQGIASLGHIQANGSQVMGTFVFTGFRPAWILITEMNRYYRSALGILMDNKINGS